MRPVDESRHELTSTHSGHPSIDSKGSRLNRPSWGRGELAIALLLRRLSTTINRAAFGGRVAPV